MQALLYSSRQFGPDTIRGLMTAEHVNRLVMVPGIVTAASRPKHKATAITLQCKVCRATKNVAVSPGLGGAHIPRYCDGGGGPGAAEGGPSAQCGVDSFVVLQSKSAFVDQQTLKLQERPEDVPTGDLPRSVLAVVDRALVGAIAPGTRITAVAIYSTFQAAGGGTGGRRGGGREGDLRAVGVQVPYLRVVGVVEDLEASSGGAPSFSAEEELAFRAFAARPDAVDDLVGRIAPDIFGHGDVKAAVACLLAGGARKRLPDGTWRRGDINVLLLGDPSTAKSQFLKFASKVAPIAVYTSGKGSSAAGLTASVVRDAAGEFYLEGGAMVLADGGVVCIDEFDKMRPEDRVAIHEAMEQQTISVAKAGITTVLKARAAVLAAANPPSGRYDDLKTAAENIDLQSTILSRFDLVFIVRDERSVEKDTRIARHILAVHTAAGAQSAEDTAAAAADERFLRRYLAYCRSRVSPRLSAAAARSLGGQYVELREQVRAVAAGAGGDAPAVPVTVRQLEAIIRVSEALARLQLLPEASPEHVRRAVALFTASTMHAVRAGVADVVFSEEARAELHAVEAQVKRRLPIGGYVSERRLVDELTRCGVSEALARRALAFMERQGELEAVRERRLVHRVR